MREKITLNRLKELVVYDSQSGRFYWSKEGAAGKRKAGTPAGFISVTNRGYRYKRIMVDRKFYLYHALVWFYHYGEWPEIIDHINRDATDNRLENLRLASTTLNNRNKGLFKNNKSGHKGVHWSKNLNRWVSKISVNSKSVHLGVFINIEDAIAARAEAEKLYSYR